MATRTPLTENRIRADDKAAHDWYRFILSFPPHFVRDYLNRFQVKKDQYVLDPFCGTGTTLVECKKLGIRSIGIEASPMAHFASQVKVKWDVDPDGLLAHAHKVAEATYKKLEDEGICDSPGLPLFTKSKRPSKSLRTLDAANSKLLLKDSISPLPLHKVLVLLDTLYKQEDSRFAPHEKLALAKGLVQHISNLHFGPEVGIGPLKKDAAVVSCWINNIQIIANDLRHLRKISEAPALVYKADSRKVSTVIESKSVDAVITSPPYPNEKDYTRTTRLESVLLGFIRDKGDLRLLKKSLVKSNTRSVFKSDEDDLFVLGHEEIDKIAKAIEARRIELGKTSGFERLYSRVARLYFGGIYRHLAELRKVLRPAARLAYVVGDQASYLRVMIRTGHILATLAESLGYEVEGIDLFRIRWATASKEQLREEVVILRWPGGCK